jgi:drug/metabolite transporter (DMT)-like permease
MILGLTLALASALGTNVAFLFKHRGAVLAPPIRVRHPLRSAADLFASRWFAIGWLVAIFAWALHVGALSLAPLSIVQAVLSGGLVFLAVVAERFFGFSLGRRQWLGVTITAAGLVVIGLTGGGANHPPRASLSALIAVEGSIFAPRRRARTDLDPPCRPAPRRGTAPRRRCRRAVRRLRRRDQIPH